MFCPYISNGDVVYLDDALFRAIIVVKEKEKAEEYVRDGPDQALLSPKRFSDLSRLI